MDSDEQSTACCVVLPRAVVARTRKAKLEEFLDKEAMVDARAEEALMGDILNYE